MHRVIESIKKLESSDLLLEVGKRKISKVCYGPRNYLTLTSAFLCIKHSVVQRMSFVASSSITSSVTDVNTSFSSFCSFYVDNCNISVHCLKSFYIHTCSFFRFQVCHVTYYPHISIHFCLDLQSMMLLLSNVVLPFTRTIFHILEFIYTLFYLIPLFYIFSSVFLEFIPNSCKYTLQFANVQMKRGRYE